TTLFRSRNSKLAALARVQACERVIFYQGDLHESRDVRLSAGMDQRPAHYRRRGPGARPRARVRPAPSLVDGIYRRARAGDRRQGGAVPGTGWRGGKPDLALRTPR